ncbi:MAG: IS256 family transposase [Acidobacteriota bacterium]
MTKTQTTIDSQLLDQLLKNYQQPDDLIGSGGILEQLTKALIERVLQGELTHHLGYDKHSPEGHNSGNSRNGSSPKTLTGKNGQIQIAVPRDRNAEFEPQFIPKHQTRFDGFDEKIISMYSRGMTTREIQAHLEEIYSVEVSPALISTLTDEVLDEVKQWQSRPLSPLYPIVWLDGLRVTVRQDGRVYQRTTYVALAVNMEGRKEVLGLWSSDNEGAKFWLSVITELKTRGVQDILIACVDGLKGFPEAIRSVFPRTLVQLCIVDLVRHSLSMVSTKDRKAVAADLKLIYSAATLEEAERQLHLFGQKWDSKYQMISRSWRAGWGEIIPMFGFAEEIRRVIYTTNAIESLNFSLRKIIRNRGLFPNDEAVMKILYLAIRNAARKWTMPIRDWRRALHQFAIIFEERIPLLMG